MTMIYSNPCDEVSGVIVGGDTDVFSFEYNGKVCDVRTFRSGEDAARFWDSGGKTADAALLRHVAPRVVNVSTGRGVAL